MANFRYLDPSDCPEHMYLLYFWTGVGNYISVSRLTVYTDDDLSTPKSNSFSTFTTTTTFF